LVVLGIGSLQLVLDRGQVDDWFNSATICVLSVVFLVSTAAFLIHSLTHKHPIINIRLFKDRNFALGTLIMAFFAGTILGSLTLFPQMLETLYGYTSNVAGIAMAPRGIASAVMMAIASQLMMRGLQARWLVVFGLFVAAYTTWLLGTISLETNFNYFILLGVVQGLGIGCFFVPLSTIVYTTLPHQSIAEAAGLFSFGRNIGNAIGISFLTTYLSRNTQFNWNVLGGHLRESNVHLQHWLAIQHLTLQDPKAVGKLSNLLGTQSNFLAYMHTYKMAGMLLMVAFIAAFFFKSGNKSTSTSATAAH
jgi:DHA2 family multidrug resistance protein